MNILIDDYHRRLTNINKVIENFKSNGSHNDIKKEERLKTKASEYRTFISEIKKQENHHSKMEQDIIDLKWLVEHGALPEELVERIQAIKIPKN